MKKIACILISAIMILLVFAGCSKAPEEKLIGRWKRIDGGGNFKRIEFFDDGTYDTSHSNYEGDFSVTDDRIRLEGVLVSSKTYTFEVSNDTLKFYYNSDEDEPFVTFEKEK